MKAETRVITAEAKDLNITSNPPEARRESWKILPHRPQKEPTLPACCSFTKVWTHREIMLDGCRQGKGWVKFKQLGDGEATEGMKSLRASPGSTRSWGLLRIAWVRATQVLFPAGALGLGLWVGLWQNFPWD